MADMIRRKKNIREKDATEAEIMGIPSAEPVEFASEEDRANWDAKLADAGQDSRRAELEDLMSRYNKAVDEEAMKRNGTGMLARTMALSNPAAAEMILKTRTPTDTLSTRKITEGQEVRGKDIKQTKDIQGVTLADQEMDPRSEVSTLYRSMLGQNGIQVPETVSAADLKRVFPFLNLDITQDNKVKLAEQERIRKQQALNQTEQGKDRRTNILAQAGIDKAVISGTMGQTERTSGGGGSASGNARLQSALTLQYPSTVFGEAGNENKFLVRRDGLPADPAVAKSVNEMNFEATKYSGALDRLERLLSDASSGLLNANVFDSAWPEIQNAFQQAVSTNIKYRGNGVANGPDIEQAVKEIGDINGLQDFIRGGGLRKVRAATSSIENDLRNVYKNTGFQLSDAPHKSEGQAVGSGGGFGGSRSGPAFDASAAAKDAFSRRGLTPPSKNNQQTQPKAQTTPAQQPAPEAQAEMVEFVLPNGIVKRISRKSATVLQAAGKGQIR